MAFSAASSTGQHCAGCSGRRSEGNSCHGISADHDPLYRFHQWQANLRVLEVTEVKTVPYVPLSHPFVERLIGTIRRECLDRTLYWMAADLKAKLLDFKEFYNRHRTHAGLQGQLPEPGVSGRASPLRYRFPLATSLSRVVPNAHRRLILRISHPHVPMQHLTVRIPHR